MGIHQWKIQQLEAQKRSVGEIRACCSTLESSDSALTDGLNNLASYATSNLNMTDSSGASAGIKKINSANAEGISALRAACDSKQQLLQADIDYYKRLERAHEASLAGGA